MHGIVSQPLYQEVWLWQACENFPIHSFIHSFTSFHFTDCKGFNNFCYVIMFFVFKILEYTCWWAFGPADMKQYLLCWRHGFCLYKFMFVDWHLCLKSLPFTGAMFRTEPIAVWLGKWSVTFCLGRCECDWVKEHTIHI